MKKFKRQKNVSPEHIDKLMRLAKEDKDHQQNTRRLRRDLQEATEKTLKSLLAIRLGEYDHDHDIKRLILEVEEQKKDDLGEYYDLILLTKYSVGYKYDDEGVADDEEMDEKIGVLVDKLMTYVSNQIKKSRK